MSNIRKIERSQMPTDDLSELGGYEVLRVIFEKQGPAVILSSETETLLRGPQGEKMRDILLESITAVLNKVIAN
jgi:hypothetical protein